MARPKRANVVDFAAHAAAVKEQHKQAVIAQRKKELSFARRVKEPHRHPLAHLTVQDLIDEITAGHAHIDRWHQKANIWKKLYETTAAQLNAASRKIVRLEKKLATARTRSA